MKSVEDSVTNNNIKNKYNVQGMSNKGRNLQYILKYQLNRNKKDTETNALFEFNKMG